MFAKLLSSAQDKIRFFPPIDLSDFRTANASAGSAPQFPLSMPASHIRHTFNGTAAIYQAAQAMGLSVGSKVLLPAYCCGAELGPFQHLQCKIEFYRLTDELQVDFEDIRSRIDSETRLLYVTHYYGLPQSQIEELAQYCQEQGVYLLEDCALALYGQVDGEALGSFGDYAIFSQRKFLPLTEGGLLVSNRRPLPKASQPTNRPPAIPAIDRLLNLLLQGLANSKHSSGMGQFLSTGLTIVSVMVKLVRTLGQRLFSTWKTPDVEGTDAVALYEYGTTNWSQKRFEAMDAKAIAKLRREVFAAWLKIAKCLPNCRPLIDRMPGDFCPLYFLLLTDDEAAKEKLIEMFETRGIEASEWWAAELEEIDWTEHQNLLPVKSRLLVVPTHHRIDINELLDCFSISLHEDSESSSCGNRSRETNRELTPA